MPRGASAPNRRRPYLNHVQVDLKTAVPCITASSITVITATAFHGVRCDDKNRFGQLLADGRTASDDAPLGWAFFPQAVWMPSQSKPSCCKLGIFAGHQRALELQTEMAG